MSPTLRVLTNADLDEAFRLATLRPVLGRRFAKMASRSVQCELWKRLLDRAAICSGVLEDSERPASERILTFGFGAFVRPDWLTTFLRDPFPFVGVSILEDLLAGNDSILLGDREVREANSSDGLSAVVLVSGWPYSKGTAPFAVKMGAAAAFLHAYKGFRLNQLITEAGVGPELDFCLSSHTWRQRKLFHVPFGNAYEGLALLGVTAAEAQENGRETSIIAPLFVRPEVRLYFTPDQQKLLWLASDHMSDKDIAKSLSIGPDAVGRRFDRIYRKVQALQCAARPIFPLSADPSFKRRLLLDHLRDNVHELRPHNFSAKRRTKISVTNSPLANGTNATA